MNKDEIFDLMAYIQAGDHRTVGDVDLAMWYNTLPKNLDLKTACEAVDMHRRESTDFLMVAHVVANARRVRADRERETARQAALTAGPSKPKSLVPWWFKRLRDAEIENYREQRKSNPEYGRVVRNGDYPVVPQYDGDNLTIEEKLKKYGIVKQPGDEAASLVAAMAVTNPTVPPKLGHFLRDPENPGEQPVEDFGA